MVRVCVKCGIEQPLITAFAKRDTRRWRHDCKACRNKFNRGRDRQYMLDKGRRYYSKHAVRLREQKRAFRQNNLLAVRKAARAYRKENPMVF